MIAPFRLSQLCSPSNLLARLNPKARQPNQQKSIFRALTSITLPVAVFHAAISYIVVESVSPQTILSSNAQEITACLHGRRRETEQGPVEKGQKRQSLSLF
jgi:hypothetical protein